MSPALMFVPPVKAMLPLPMPLLAASTVPLRTPWLSGRLTAADVEKVISDIVEWLGLRLS